MLRERGMTVVFVEQNAVVGLRHAGWGAVLDLGRTLFEGRRAKSSRPRIQELYLGRAAAAAA